MQDIHWYPGHMAKAKRQLNELIRYLDVILEIRDARLPLTSHNSDLESLLERRPSIVVLNKIDLAESRVTRLWAEWFRIKGTTVLEVNGKSGEGIAGIWETLSGWIDSPKSRRVLRVGVVGIPNVGKSSVLNRLMGTGSAKTGNLPGITRGKQWIKRHGFEILDTPGLLPPKIANREAGLRLALVGTIREEIVPAYDLALLLLERYGGHLSGWEKPVPPLQSGEEQLEWYARKRGFLGKGGVPDLNRAVLSLLKEFRDGRLGRISLETPPDGPAAG